MNAPAPDRRRNVTRYPVEKTSAVYSPADWQDYSERNLAAANAQLRQSLDLQSTCASILAHVASHLRMQKDLTDRSLERRVAEVRDAKRLLEEQLSETTVKLGEMEQAVDALEHAIAAKQAPLATCQVSLDFLKTLQLSRCF